ncbi:protein phosphatase 2C domain-containing protein [Streptomyces sp. NPDC090127]|uniref:protein phosphatase 2C domain-containing protein n=1 Tax=Streptomyces sp. NPDC090127 TaxID=3365953 RepID=UPI00382E25D7
MTQQGDNWWDKLYDESAPDTVPTTTGDTLDDRFDSASRATTDAPLPTTGTRPPGAPGGTAPPTGEAPPSRVAPPAQPRAPRAPWEPLDDPGPATGSLGLDADADADSGLDLDLALDPGARPSDPGARPSDPGARPSDPGAPRPTASGTAPRSFPAPPPHPPAPPVGDPPPPPPPVPPGADADADATLVGDLPGPLPRPRTAHVGNRPPTYDAEPTALPTALPGQLGELVADTVLDGARYGSYTLRAVSQRGDSARYRGEPRRDALLTARFGQEEAALVLVAVATGARAAEGAHLAAADACRWIAEAVGRSHARLSEDIRSGRRGDLKSGLQRLTDRTYGKLRARAAERGVEPGEYTAGLRCLLLCADPDCRTRVFFGVGPGGLFRLRDGAWQDIEPLLPEPAALTGAPVVGFGSPPAETAEGDRRTMRLGVLGAAPGAPFAEDPARAPGRPETAPPAEPFRFRASVARPGDTLLLASKGLAEPMRGEPALAKELAERWASAEPPGLAAYLADTQLRVKGYADDRTAVAVWEA